MINDKVYDRLKWVALIGLPALGALYFALAELWRLPAAEQVVGTIVVIDTFLGALLGISTSNYNKQVSGGIMHIDEIGDKVRYSLELEGDPQELMTQEEVRFKVQRPS